MLDRVVIFGSNGFIGSELTRKLKSIGYDAIGISRQDCNFLNREEFAKKIIPIIKDSILIYAAGKHKQHGDSLEVFHENILTILNLLWAANSALPKKIFFLSTIEVYGCLDPFTTISEKLELNPDTLYAAGKAAHENLFKVWGHCKNIPVTSLRLPGVFGIQDNATSVIGKIFLSIKESSEFSLFTNGNEKRDYVSVDDLSSCIAELISLKNVPAIINIGTGESVSINFIIQLVESQTRNKLKLRRTIPEYVGFDIEIDTTLLRAYLPYFKFQSINSSIARYVDDFKLTL